MRKFLAGLAVGYAVGTLWAPKRGNELRVGIIGRVTRLLSQCGLWEELKEPQDADNVLAYALNQASEEELKAIRGIGRGLARKIIRHRPYRTGNEIIEDKILPEPTFERLKEQFT